MLLKVASFSGHGENTTQNEILLNGDRMYEGAEQPDLDNNKNLFENNEIIHNADSESYCCLDDRTINNNNNLIIEAASSDLIFLDDTQIISIPYCINENKTFTEATDLDEVTDTQKEMPDPSARDNTQSTKSMSIPNDNSAINQDNNGHYSHCVETTGSSDYSSYKESDGSQKRSRKRKKNDANWKKNIVNAYETVEWNISLPK